MESEGVICVAPSAGRPLGRVPYNMNMNTPGEIRSLFASVQNPPNLFLQFFAKDTLLRPSNLFLVLAVLSPV